MDHSYFKDRISGYYDNNLPPYEQQSVEEHLKSCEECQKLLAQFEKLEKLVEEKSMLSDTEYWEKSAQKIENAIGISDTSKVVDVSRKSFKGLFWKISAAAASIAALTFIAVNQNEIAPEAQMKVSQPPEVQVENKLDINNRKTIAETTVITEIADEFIEKDKIESTEKFTDEAADRDEIDKKEKTVQEIYLDTVVKKNEVLEDALKKQSMAPSRASKPMAVSPQAGDVQIQDESNFESAPVLLEETIVQSQSAPVNIQGSAESVQQLFADGLAPSDKVNLDYLRKKKDSLSIIYSSYSQADKIKLKAGRSKSVAMSDTLNDSSKSVIEKELLETYYKIGLNSENELEKLESVRFFENYIDRKESIHIDLAGKYLAGLKK